MIYYVSRIPLFQLALITSTQESFFYVLAVKTKGRRKIEEAKRWENALTATKGWRGTGGTVLGSVRSGTQIFNRFHFLCLAFIIPVNIST